MKVTQAAKELNRDPATIKRWIKQGKLEGYKIGRDWEIPDNEVKRLKGGN